MDIDELAHTLGVVFCGSSFGDLDLTPGSMRVEEDEQVDRSVAFIFAVGAFDLARLGWDRLVNLADELGRALIETDHWAFRIGDFGVEVEHILHGRDILAVDLRNTPHVLAPGLEVVFGQPPTYGFAGYAGVFSEADQLTRQQLQGPTGAALRGLGAGGGD